MERQATIYGPKRGVGETRILVKDHARRGLTARQIADALGVSTQAVHRHLAKLREDGELEEQAS